MKFYNSASIILYCDEQRGKTTFIVAKFCCATQFKVNFAFPRLFLQKLASFIMRSFIIKVLCICDF